MLTFAAVPLVCLDGRAETLAAASRYLLFALVGSVLYLRGAALFYGRYGTLDIFLLRAVIHGEPAAYVAAALVVNASFFLTVRLRFYVLPGLLDTAAAPILATLGSCAILFGSVLALRQARLKLLIAYSTLAQIGYLFLMFPLAGATAESFWNAGAWTGGILQAVSHAFA